MVWCPYQQPDELGHESMGHGEPLKAHFASTGSALWSGGATFKLS